MNVLDIILLLASVICLLLAGATWKHRKTTRIRWEWIGIACFIATFLVDKLAAIN